mgnify:CR=1 FL=1
MPTQDKPKTEGSPRKLLLWTAIIGLIFGLIGFGELPEDLLRTSRNSLHQHKASGDIVFVSIDDRSMSEIGRLGVQVCACTPAPHSSPPASIAITILRPPLMVFMKIPGLALIEWH